MFKVGTICIGRNFIVNTYRNGDECEILEDRGVRDLFVKQIGEILRGVHVYKIKWTDGFIDKQPVSNLRPKHYPGSWEDELFQEVLKELGWNPFKVTEVIK